jgi:hypothetical protein
MSAGTFRRQRILVARVTSQGSERWLGGLIGHDPKRLHRPLQPVGGLGELIGGRGDFLSRRGLLFARGGDFLR